MNADRHWPIPDTTRSRVVLEIASELVAIGAEQPLRQAKVLLRRQGSGDAWRLALFGSDTKEGIDAVVRGDAVLGMVNPACILALAARGSPPFAGPQPLRLIGTIPSFDQLVFGVKRATGLRAFEEIGTRRVPLRISLRGQPDHSLHLMLEHVAQAAGFALEDIVTWGGELRREGLLPFPDGPKFAALQRGEIDAIFDEAVQEWIEPAIDAGMRILPLAEATVTKLEAMGYRRAVIERRLYPKLDADVLTLDFSGWPIFVRADLDDRLVGWICAALDARKHNIPWQGDGPLPIHKMVREGPDTPLDVPLHPAAERFWRERGYLV